MKHYQPSTEPVSEQFLDAVLSEQSYYGPMIKGMAKELRELRGRLNELDPRLILKVPRADP